MKVTRSQLRRIIRESLEDERDNIWEKIMKLFFNNAHLGISTAKALGDVDQQFIENMIKLQDAGTAIVDSAKQGGPKSSAEEDSLSRQWYEAYLDVTQRSRRFSGDVEESIGQLKDLFQGAQNDAWYLSYPIDDPWPTTGPLADLVEWTGAERPK